jgi:hypothetical protein
LKLGLSRSIKSWKDAIELNRKMASNEKSKPKDRIKTSKRIVNAQYNILKLLKMGSDAEYFEII